MVVYVYVLVEAIYPFWGHFNVFCACAGIINSDVVLRCAQNYVRINYACACAELIKVSPKRVNCFYSHVHVHDQWAVV